MWGFLCFWVVFVVWLGCGWVVFVFFVGLVGVFFVFWLFVCLVWWWGVGAPPPGGAAKGGDCRDNMETFGGPGKEDRIEQMLVN